MATNQAIEGADRLAVVVTYPASPVSGNMCRFGSLCGIAMTDENTDGTTEVDFSRDRAWNLSVTATGGAIAKGDKLYFHDASGINNVAANGYFCGIALEAIASGTATIKVKLEGPGEVGSGSLKVAKVALTGGAANAFAFAWQNPEASAIAVTKVLLDITTAGGTATAVLDIGTGATATTHSDNLIDGIDANATGLSDNITEKGSNGKSRQRMDENGGTTDYLTGQILTEAATALVGNVYIHYEVL
jgi:predicted RecA/RadA family phage recombinase